MNPRERALAGVIAFLVIVWGGWTGWRAIESAFESREIQLANLNRTYKDANRTRLDSQRALRDLDQWREMSLPSNQREAQTLYLQWLRRELDESNFDDVEIRPNPNRGRRNIAYQQLRFIVSGNGTLEQLTSFLYGFYRVNCLHKIETLSMRPIKDSDNLALNMTISALALPGVTHENALNERTAARLVHGALDDYKKTIVARKLFTAHMPSQEAPTAVVVNSGGPLQSDEAKKAKVTGIVSRPGGWQAWMHLQSTNQRLLLGVGDAVDVGNFHATVLSITPRAVVLSSGDQRLQIGLGQNLGEATVLPTEGS